MTTTRLFFILMVSGLLFTLKTEAQETYSHVGEHPILHNAWDHFEAGRYAAALEEVEPIRQQEVRSIANKHRSVRQYADYIRAVSLYYLEDKRAIEALQAVVADYPDATLQHRALFFSGLYYHNKKKPKDAIAQFEQVDQNHLDQAERLEMKYKWGYAHFRKKEFKEALPLFRTVRSASGPYQEDAAYYSGFIAYEEKRYQEALSSFTAIENSERYATVVPFYRTSILYKEGQYDQVIAYAEPFAKNTDIEYYDELRHVLGQAYYKTGNYSQALYHFDHYFEQTKKVSPQAQFQYAFTHYKTGDYSEAAKRFQPLSLADDTLGQHAMYLLGDCRLQTGQKRLAQSAFFKASQMPYDAELVKNARYYNAKLLADLGDYNTSVEELTSFLDDYPNDVRRPEVARLVGQILVQSKDYDRAIQLIDQYGDNSEATRNALQQAALFHAIDLYNDNQYNKALERAKLAKREGSKTDYRNLATLVAANAYYQQKNYQPAIDAYTNYLGSMAPNTADLPWANRTTAAYQLAYAYFQRDQFEMASRYFADVAGTNENTEMTTDAALRSGDCFLMTGLYDRALSAYTLAINRNHPDADYAYLQMAAIYKLEDKTTDEQAILKTFLADFPNSSYADDAAFQLAGSTYRSDNRVEAKRRYGQFINTYPNSPYIPKALLQSALIDMNLGNTNEAITTYKTIARKYPADPAARSAMIALREIYVAQGNAEAFIAFTEEVQGTSLTASTRDSLRFASVEELYLNKQCDQVITAAGRYLTDFPSGTFGLQANYYRAECLFEAKRYNEALPHYQVVNKGGLSPYLEKSLVRSSFIAYEEIGDYTLALNLYEQLLSVAAFESNRKIAIVGRMRSAQKLERHADVLAFADNVLAEQEAVDLQLEARFYKAKSAFALNRYDVARTLFGELVDELPLTSTRAECDYHLALIDYKERDYEASMARCQEIKNLYSAFERWTVKTYILIADNHAAMNNLFQARATLESILAYYEGDQALLDEAQRKLDRYSAEERSKAPVDFNEEPNDSIIFQNENE